MFMLKAFGVHYPKLCSILCFFLILWAGGEILLFLHLLILLCTTVNSASDKREFLPETYGYFSAGIAFIGVALADFNIVANKQTAQGAFIKLGHRAH